jgi:valyl-tRNA synthetase
MDKRFDYASLEPQLYAFWEKNGYFTAKPNPSKKPFTIILPPPNTNANLHLGHAMYVYEDIMIRYHKMMGYETLWLPGADHAGFETQFVYEKQLAKEGKSRFDFDRETLFNNIWDFVMQNRGNMENQLRRLGFALDWSKKKFTMDKDIVAIVHRTFKQLFDAGLIYRANRLVNYCTKDGTSFSDLEVVSKETEGTLYYIKFPIKGGGDITIATTRPETMLGDVAVMVNPKDKRYKDLIGKEVELPLTDRVIPIIGDDYVDMKFGTGAVKVTPAHDFNDFEIAKKHNLTYPPVIGFNGKMQNTGLVDGMRVKAAREEVVKLLTEKGFLEKTKPHAMVQKTCYKCGTVLEPLPMAQWYIKVKPLTDKAIKLIKDKKVVIMPKRFEKTAVDWLTNFHDWNISRQTVWGIRIPAYHCRSKDQWFVSLDTPTICHICGKADFEQDTDTFDTWFSSGQWPFATLETLGKDIADYFYPTSVMETGYDILPWWVVRMMMLGKYITGDEPFQKVYLHGMVRDKHGAKMSKSKGNVINPLDLVDKFGADALRAALVFGTKEGGDTNMSEEKTIAMRNFANKIWNVGRFIWMGENGEKVTLDHPVDSKKETLKALEKEMAEHDKRYTKHMKAYQFAKAFDETYEFLWHRFADFYIEEMKDNIRIGDADALKVLKDVYFRNLKMLHPFIPYVTEAVWQVFHGKESSILG